MGGHVSRHIMRIVSLTYLIRKIIETRTKTIKEYIETSMVNSNAYILRKQRGLRNNLHY
jgi:hypothetical protein